jgi:DNA ligase-1
LFDDRGAVFIAYDILRRGGEDLRGLATATRRAVLEEVLGDAAGVSAGGGALRLAPVLGESTWEGLAERREASRARGVEGLMLKHAEAPYHAGRTRADPTWWKWKVDPLSVDAVLIYAQAGSGRRATLFTDYTFGLWETDAETGEAALVPFAKAYSGLTNEEIEAVDRFVRNHTEGKMGPVRKVTPELVFEIGYEGVRRSSRHASGVAVRFPRMLRWRRDKAASEADWLEAVRRQIEGG